MHGQSSTEHASRPRAVARPSRAAAARRAGLGARGGRGAIIREGLALLGHLAASPGAAPHD